MGKQTSAIKIAIMFHLKNLFNMKDFVYTVVLNGIIYRGSRQYIAQKVADYRENHGLLLTL